MSLITKGGNAIVIAEIGINHSGDFEIAKDIVLNSRKAGATAVKFQYRNLARAYSKSRNEIGDAIVGDEIIRNFLDVNQIINLAEYAHEIGLYAGISFFVNDDITDFSSQIEIFDFFKIPSPEMTNLELILELINLDKFVFISTGAHSENEIENTFSYLPKDGWMPMHCVSNYPTIASNAKLGYLSYLQNRWNIPVGFSSHDEEWPIIVGAIALGAKVVERHITHDKNTIGLDHSTSSDFIEFSKICTLARQSQEIFSGNSQRVANQGELINLQNLGRSYYAKREIKSGEAIVSDDFEYRAPRIGLGYQDFQNAKGKLVLEDLKMGSVLTSSHLIVPIQITKEVSSFARSHKISIPVRVHDYKKIREELVTGYYELHLSYTEVNELENLFFINNEDSISIHLPDYVSPNMLVDPYSNNLDQRDASLEIISKVVRLVSEYQHKTRRKILVVGSFSRVWGSNDIFYDNHAELLKSIESAGVTMCFQWLPPIAWYFGGSTKIDVFNQQKDAKEIVSRGLPICLDTSHLLLGANYFKFDARELVSAISSNVIHAHISDAVGIDGEGMPFGTGPISNTNLILDICDLDIVKVIEVWQGHANNFEGFKLAILKIKELHEER